MRLHLVGDERQGGAYAATHYWCAAYPGTDCFASPGGNYLTKAWRNTYGWLDPLLVSKWVNWSPPRNFDEVHLHRWSDWGPAAIKIAQKVGRKTIWHVLDYNIICSRDCFNVPNCDYNCAKCYQPQMPMLLKWPIKSRRKRLIRWVNQVDEIICLSHHSENLLREWGITAPITVEPLVVNLKPRDVPRYPNTIMFAGWLADNKGWPLIQRLRSRFPNEAWWVMGMNKETPKFSNEGIIEILSRCTVLLVPEQWPTMGSVIVAEAMALNTPIIASNIGGLPEQLAGYHHHWLCDPTNEQQWVDTIKEVLCNSPY